MVPTRSRAHLALILGLLTILPGSVQAQNPESKQVTAIERTPYAIRVMPVIAPEARIDRKAKSAMLDAWQALNRRFVGAPWAVEIIEGSYASAVPLALIDPESLAPDAVGADRLWLIRVEPAGSALEVSGRSYDPETKSLGPIQRRRAIVRAELPRTLFRLALDLFVPSARIEESSAGGVSITVQGGALPAGSPLGEVVTAGSVFRPFRVFQSPKGETIQIDEIRWSYLKVDSLAGPVARCSIVSGLRDPLTRRVARRNHLIARGVKPSDQPTRLKFTTEPDKDPAAGYVLTARTVPDGVPFEVGTTDREGRIELGPGVRRELLVFRLLSGSIEPMVEFPAMPGDISGEHAIPFNPKAQTVALEIQLDSLKDAIVDVVAVRARLESRLKARLAGSDWDAADEALAEYRKLTPRSNFADRLTKLKDEAARKQAETKTAILTKTAQAQVADVQALIDRYLDDDAFKAYSEAVAQGRAAPREKAAPARAVVRDGLGVPTVLPGAAAVAPGTATPTPDQGGNQVPVATPGTSPESAPATVEAAKPAAPAPKAAPRPATGVPF